MKKIIVLIGFFGTLLATTTMVFANNGDTTFRRKNNLLQDASPQLPPGFTATIIATGLDGARHLAITRQGGIYIKLSRLKDGKSIYYLQDTIGDGVLKVQYGFGDYPGTGIFIKDNYLYASINDDVYRYFLNNKGEVINPGQPEKIVTGLVNRNRDNSKSIAIDDHQNL